MTEYKLKLCCVVNPYAHCVMNTFTRKISGEYEQHPSGCRQWFCKECWQKHNINNGDPNHRSGYIG